MSKTELFYPTRKKSWSAINWKKAERSIVYLQNRITKASQKNQKRQVRNLQRLLIRSLSARLKAVKQVSQQNWHSKSQLKLTSDFKFKQALSLEKEKYIFSLKETVKKQIKIKNINLLIDQFRYKISQTLWYFSLIPVSNLKIKNSSFSCDETPKKLYKEIQKIFFKKIPPKWILKINMEEFFTNINFQTFAKNIPIEKKVLLRWFRNKSYKNKNLTDKSQIFCENEDIENKNLSLVILNLILKPLLHFLDSSFKNKYSESTTIFSNNFLKFNSTFVITAFTKEQLEFLKNLIFLFFNKNGFLLTKNKIQLIQLTGGFELGGWAFGRSKNSYFFSQISQSALSAYKNKIKQFIKKSKSVSLPIFISKLSQKILDWKQHYFLSNRFIKMSSQLDKYLFRILLKWARKRHGKKNCTWIFHNYWRCVNGKNVFSTRDIQSKRIYKLLSYSNSCEII